MRCYKQVTSPKSAPVRHQFFFFQKKKKPPYVRPPKKTSSVLRFRCSSVFLFKKNLPPYAFHPQKNLPPQKTKLPPQLQVPTQRLLAIAEVDLVKIGAIG
jgi:hypothetical protein